MQADRWLIEHIQHPGQTGADSHDVLEILGRRGVEQHLVDEVQAVYRAQGVAIYDKHIEIIRQMLRRGTVIKSNNPPE